MACEKSADASLAPPRHAWQQMSAAQPLVFLPRPLYHKENVKKPLFSMFLLKYISPASRFICKSQFFHSHQIWHMLITYSSHTHPEDN